MEGLILNQFKKEFKKYYINLAFEHYRLKAKLGYANDYIISRGFNIDIIDEFNIGISLGKDSFVKIVKDDFRYNPIFDNYKNTIDIDVVLYFLESLKLVYNTKKNIYPSSSYYEDYIQDSIIFPLYNENGDIDGFSTRYIGNLPKKPKYINNYFNYVGFFGLNKLIKRLENSNYGKFDIYLVEGVFDALRLYTKNKLAIPLLGSSLNVPYLNKIILILKKYESKIEQINICLDNDKAGNEGINAIINYLIDNSKFRICITHIENEKDIDAFLLLNDTIENVEISNRLRDIAIWNYKSNTCTKHILRYLTYIDNTNSNLSISNKVSELSKLLNVENYVIKNVKHLQLIINTNKDFKYLFEMLYLYIKYGNEILINDIEIKHFLFYNISNVLQNNKLKYESKLNQFMYSIDNIHEIRKIDNTLIDFCSNYYILFFNLKQKHKDESIQEIFNINYKKVCLAILKQRKLHILKNKVYDKRYQIKIDKIDEKLSYIGKSIGNKEIFINLKETLKYIYGK